MKTKFLILLLLISTVSGIAQVQIPLPTPIQQAWQNAELTVLISYDLHVSDREKYHQPQNRITPITDYNIFNPEKLDTDQWIEAVKGMGARLAILTVTHETGFALYQSDVNPYCMKALKYKDGKGDIVRDFVASCRKFGILPGLYIGIRWNSFMGVYDFMVHSDSSQFARNRQAYYNRLCEKMTEELMSRYGELSMVWFDGGAHGPELGGADILPIVEKYQKNIIFYHNTQRADIRWGGSESGTVSYPCWGTFPYPFSHSTNQKEIFKDDFRLLKVGDPNGKYYMPAMSDAPLRGYNGHHEWFWEPGDEAYIFPLENLMKMYYGSVGRNSTLILGITPDADGLIPESDAKRIREFGDEIKRRFSNPIASTSGTGNLINLKLQKRQKVNQLVLKEDFSKGERVRKFVVEGRTSKGWQTISEGTCIGHKFIHLFDPVEVSAFRLKIPESIGDPLVSEFSVFYIE
ncbi:MAG: alpha-L-fucosidase [Bacteroidetes bacterium]|nr:alpha-L-fucosidase [Bacteroidota bacterium]